MGNELRLPRIRVAPKPAPAPEALAGSGRAEILMARMTTLEAKLAQTEATCARIAKDMARQQTEMAERLNALHALMGDMAWVDQAEADLPPMPVDRSLPVLLEQVCQGLGIAVGNVIGHRCNGTAKTAKLAFLAKARAAGFTYADVAATLQVSTNALRVQAARERRDQRFRACAK